VQEVAMLPRMLLRLRRVVRQSVLDGRDTGFSGEETARRWYATMAEMHRADREAERRLKRAEQALNHLSPN
jgi:hypothetical protein